MLSVIGAVLYYSIAKIMKNTIVPLSHIPRHMENILFRSPGYHGNHDSCNSLTHILYKVTLSVALTVKIK